MEILSYNLPLDWNLFLFGDDHEGAALRHDHGWEQLVDMMHSEYGGLPAKNNFGIHHGDLIEAILTDDKRWCDTECSKEKTVFEQMAASRKALLPIRKKLLAVLDGNHTFALHRFGKIAKEICKQLEIPEKYGTYSAKLIYKDKKDNIQFKHYATHGTGSISSVADDPERQKTNMRLSLKRKLRSQFGDCLLSSMGHTHKIIVCEPTKELYITDEDNELKQHYTGAQTIPNGYIHPDYRWYCNTGSFLKLYGMGFSGYAERAGYKPIELGFLVVKIRNGIITGIEKEVLE
jgi:hypothetical protein